jgi:hypothetical protein
MKNFAVQIFVILAFLISSRNLICMNEHMPQLILSKSETELKSDKRHKPLFFQLTKNGKTVNIIGSNHTIPPQILFSKEMYKKFEELLKDSFILTEHPSLFDHLTSFADLKKTKNSSNKNELIHEDKRIFLLEKSKYINVDEVEILGKKINNLIGMSSNLSYNQSILFIYTNILHEYRKIIPGFESTIRSMPNIKISDYLESIKDFMEIFETYNNHHFLANSFDLLYSLQQKDIVKTAIKSYRDIISTYDKDQYKSTEVSLFNKTRNKLWLKKVLELVKDPQINQPILIICGSAHLKGFGVTESGSFISLLINNGFDYKTGSEFF